MNAALVMTLSLLGQCPGVSEYRVPRIDKFALVEVVDERTSTSFGWDPMVHVLQVEVEVIGSADGGPPPGERLVIPMRRFGPDPDLHDSFRVFERDLLNHRGSPWTHGKCQLPPHSVGKRFFVALIGGRLFDWWPVEDLPPESAVTADGEATSILVVKIEGPREGTFSLDDPEIDFEQPATVRKVIRGTEFAAGSSIRLEQRGTLGDVSRAQRHRRRVTATIRLGFTSDRLPPTLLPEWIVGEECLVHLRGRQVLGWRTATDHGLDQRPNPHGVEQIANRLATTPFAPQALQVDFLHLD